MSLKRDAQNFLAVIDSNKGIIYKVANSYCKDEENRKDLIQEIIVQLWLSFDKYDETYKLTTWIYRIALNVSISFYRKEHRRNEINQPLPDGILYLEGNNQQEIAEILGLTMTNISTKVSRIKQQLKQKFSTLKS